MKKVVSEDQVAHLWANQLQDEARKSNKSFYFEGRTIYSYGRHFPIAVISKIDPQIVLFTTRKYSNTTAKHIYTVSYACNHKTKIYCKNPDKADRGMHLENIADFESNAKQQALKLKNARKPEIYLYAIAAELERLQIYCKHFNIDIPGLNLVYVHVKSKDGGNKATELEREALMTAYKKRMENLKKQHAKELREFRSFKKQRLYTHDGNDYLRYNTEKKRIETSQGVEIPAAIAQKFYKHIIATIKKGGCVECNSKLLDYSVTEINKDSIKVGCHHVTMKEINLMAKKLKWV